MTVQMSHSVPGFIGQQTRTQCVALCYRMTKDKVQVLLVTSRGTGRWILPKGWPINGKSAAETALQEAWEEAGVKGRARDICLGMYSYGKWMGPDRILPCVGLVYPVQVKSLALKYPEKEERRRKWFSLKKAASKLDEAELAELVRSFDPGMITRH